MSKPKLQCIADIASSILKDLVTNNGIDHLQNGNQRQHTVSTWDDVAWSHSSVQKKANIPTLRPRFLVKFLRVGKEIDVKCPTYMYMYAWGSH